MSNKYTELVPLPAKGSLNVGKTSCPTARLVALYGPPVEISALTDDCQPPTSKFWKARLVTQDVGPFRVTGHKMFLAALRRGFSKLQVGNPELYKMVESAGGLCVRRVRGTKDSVSNHSLGLAVDIRLNGTLDVRGDNKIQRGLLEVYSYLKTEGIFIGATFPTEDAMHFEASSQLVDQWIKQGTF